jgi:hypothetical protein
MEQRRNIARIRVLKTLSEMRAPRANLGEGEHNRAWRLKYVDLPFCRDGAHTNHIMKMKYDTL